MQDCGWEVSMIMTRVADYGEAVSCAVTKQELLSEVNTDLGGEWVVEDITIVDRDMVGSTIRLLLCIKLRHEDKSEEVGVLHIEDFDKFAATGALPSAPSESEIIASRVAELVFRELAVRWMTFSDWGSLQERSY